MTLLSGVARGFVALFAKDTDEELPEITEKENLTVLVQVSLDTRKKDSEVAYKRLTSAACDIINDAEDEGFSIITGKDNRLTADKIRLSKKVHFSPNGKSIFREDAKIELEKYLAELKESGMLEQ